MSVVGLLPSILTVYLSTRVFAPEVYGQLALIVTTATLIQSVGFNWLSSALVRFGREEYVRTGGVRQTFRVRLVLLALIWVVAAAAFAALYIFGRSILTIRLGLSGRLLWSVPLFLTLWVFNAELTGYLRTLGRYVHMAAASLVGQLFTAGALLVLFTRIGTGGIDLLIAISVGAALSQSAYLLLWLKRDDLRIGANEIDSRGLLRRMIRYSAPAIATSILNYADTPVQVYLVLYFVSVSAVGLFSTANSMDGVIVQFVMLFPTLMFPILQGLKADGKRSMVQQYFHRVVPQLSILFALGATVALVILPPVVHLLLGPRYYPAIGAFLILAYAEIPHMTTALESIYPSVYDRMSQTFWIAGLQLLCQLVSYVLLIPRLGIEGVAWGIAVAYLASSFLLNHYVAQEFGSMLGANLAVVISAILGLGALLLARSALPLLVQLTALSGILISSGAAIKLTKLFHAQDADLLLTTGMPSFLKAPFKFLYRILS